MLFSILKWKAKESPTLFCIFESMNNLKLQEFQPSIFAQMVDRLRNKSEAELKLLYTRFFQKELKDDWKSITQNADFRKTSEADIIKAIQKNRYRQ